MADSHTKPIPSESGIVCSGGIRSIRVPHAIYQAWRISQLVSGIPNPKILEIGGGAGRTALYATQFGITDYTIIDILVSSLAQGNFLGRVIGSEKICLHGEAPLGSDGLAHKVKLLTPSTFLDGAERYDLVLNVDSLTEIGGTAAGQYWAAIEKRADVFCP